MTALINKAMNHMMLYIAVGLLLIACAAVGLRLYYRSTPAGVNSRVSTPSSGGSGTAAAVCGRSILNSPYNYHGPAGSYSSGTVGLPTYGTPGSDFPNDTAGVVLPAGTHNYANYELRPSTVYYLLPGKHIGSLAADADDSFVGGLSDGVPTILSGNYSGLHWAIDSNSTNGNQPGVTIEYLTIEKFQPPGNGGAINQDSNTGWTVQYNTIALNAPGAGVILGADNTLKDNCITLNGQYGFQAENTDSWGTDPLTGGPYNLTVKGNEISYNDTCDFEGLLDNPALGWSKYDPVPARYRNPECGKVFPDGDQGGFKLWRTNGVTIEGNYIHNNWGPGGWADTGNANTTYAGNTIINNDGEAIIEEISYNFSITNNYISNNGWIDGLANAAFPTPAIYISESGSDRTFGGVPACSKALCPGQGSYPAQSFIRGNIVINNSGSILLWQDSNRFCGDGTDDICTLVDGGPAGPFTLSGCKSNLSSASISTTASAAKATGSPLQDWWDGCLWRTENVIITHNVIDFNPASIPYCNHRDWPACGAGGILSNYGSLPNHAAGWVVPTRLTFFQGNSWSDNSYNGPSTFYAWNQGNAVSWAAWTGSVLRGDKCSSPGERSGGYCTGPFGQDAGSTYNSRPLFDATSTDVQQSEP
ncbi:MAG: right-handed parallel beta-helix repeat-containing protein [Isosphaeraceae bacterium]